MSEQIPPNRWEQLVSGPDSPYARAFEERIARGQDIDGEARLVDALAPRGARILDAGAGIGRVAGALAARGHDVTAVEKDPDLVSRSRSLFPGVPVLECDILALTPALLEQAGRPATYDVVVVVGNVMVYLAEDSEARALRTLAALLVPGGRILVGFHPQKGPPHSRDYPVERFRADVEAAGLAVQHVFGSYELDPPADDYVVAVLQAV
jgi:SAM-dependent methyltransferase